MFNSPIPSRLKLPAQDPEIIRIIADRWWRGTMGMQDWANRAKEATDMFEGRQWDAAAIAKLVAEQRPILTFNKIAPLVRLVLGYMRNNRTDVNYQPANEGPSSQQVAEILTRIEKQVNEMNQMPHVGAEVFMDGIVTGRGFFDTRLNFDENDFGEIKKQAVDPFTVVLDPDGDKYDINNGKYVATSRWASLDEVEYSFGKHAADAVRPFIGSGRGQTWGSFPFMDMAGEEVTPLRTFGEVSDPESRQFQDFFHTELIDPTRKSVRIIDMQSNVWRLGEVFIDLETGDRLPVPDEVQLAAMMPNVPAQQRKAMFIQKTMAHAQELNNPLVIDVRPIKRVQWSVMIGDLIVHHAPSIYDTYTLTGFFPYFRRGFTRGMVEDMMDPQREINKRRSSEIDIVTRTANSGWIRHEQSVSPEEEQNWRLNSAKPGFQGVWRGESHMKPERINPAPPPTSMERLEEKGRQDLREISGINESALGELDRVQSGRAIEARQRQAVIAIQMYMDNFSRTNELLGRKDLEIMQKHYTQERMFRIVGEDGKLVQTIINQRVTAEMLAQQAAAQGLPPPPMPPSAVDRLNDITIGRYTVAVDETPLSATFASAQFEEMTTMLEKMGPLAQVLMSLRPDLIVDMSSLPRKEEWMEALRQASAQMAGQQAAAGAGVQIDPATGQPIPQSQPAAGGAPSIVQGKAPDGQVVSA